MAKKKVKTPKWVRKGLQRASIKADIMAFVDHINKTYKD